MAKKAERKDLKVVENKHIDDGYRAEDGRESVSPGPQRKHDTAEYHEPGRELALENAEPVEPVSVKDATVGLYDDTSAQESARAADSKAKGISVKDGVASESK